MKHFSNVNYKVIAESFTLA